MRVALPLSLVAALLLATPTFAGLTGMGANLFGNYFSFPKPNLDKPPVNTISAGSLKLELQHTKLKDVAKAFGGTIYSQGEGSGRATWLCYATEDANTWFISNALGGFEFVMIVAVEASGGKAAADCDTPNAKFKLPDMGIPGLGASTDDLKAAFGAARGGKIAYRADVLSPMGTANTAQYIGYVLKGGKVTGYGAGESGVQNLDAHH